MARYDHHHVINTKVTGYIAKKDLEGFLKKRFPKADITRFEIKEKNEKFEFWAPEKVPDKDMK
ncbi:hypothetical protein SLS56_004694 [Neofusicoccum ribis]|uniref:Uncharacterized protein n=1 Tax=Neofusicoccum ribis TaxID=45134 RepID=A0ABR3SVV8_9PEZI